MKKTFLIIISISAVFILNTCALEIANVIGPDGGYVFYDKGNYSYGWRYIQCSPYDFGELKDSSDKSIESALKLCNENSAEWHKFGWELPTEAHMRKMLECFSYGLTKFSPGYYYLAVNNLYSSAPRYWICKTDKEKNTGKYCSECGTGPDPNQDWFDQNDAPPNPDFLTDPNDWDSVILHKNFDNDLNGKVEIAKNAPDIIRIRPIRRF